MDCLQTTEMSDQPRNSRTPSGRPFTPGTNGNAGDPPLAPWTQREQGPVYSYPTQGSRLLQPGEVVFNPKIDPPGASWSQSAAPVAYTHGSPLKPGEISINPKWAHAFTAVSAKGKERPRPQPARSDSSDSWITDSGDEGPRPHSQGGDARSVRDNAPAFLKKDAQQITNFALKRGIDLSKVHPGPASKRYKTADLAAQRRT